MRGVEAPLSAVGVAGDDQIDLVRAKVLRHVFRVVAKQNPVAGLRVKGGQPAQFRRRMSCPDASGGIRIKSRIRLCFSPGLICAHPGRGQPAAAKPGSSGGETDKAVVQHHCAGICNQVQIGLVEHPLVVPEGDEGRRDNRAGLQQFQRRPALPHLQDAGFFWGRGIYKVPGNQNKIGPTAPEAFQDRAWRSVVAVCQKGSKERTAGNGVVGLKHLACSFRQNGFSLPQGAQRRKKGKRGAAAVTENVRAKHRGEPGRAPLCEKTKGAA